MDDKQQTDNNEQQQSKVTRLSTAWTDTRRFPCSKCECRCRPLQNRHKSNEQTKREGKQRTGCFRQETEENESGTQHNTTKTAGAMGALTFKQQNKSKAKVQ